MCSVINFFFKFWNYKINSKLNILKLNLKTCRWKYEVSNFKKFIFCQKVRKNNNFLTKLTKMKISNNINFLRFESNLSWNTNFFGKFRTSFFGVFPKLFFWFQKQIFTEVANFIKINIILFRQNKLSFSGFVFMFALKNTFRYDKLRISNKK